MANHDEKRTRIKIMENGPYLVSGHVPLRKMNIFPTHRINEYRHVQDFPLAEAYALCRCGQTRTPPYCDGSHAKAGFIGKETASRLPYIQRADHITGPDLDLKDDGRCAYVRFCHRREGTAWELVLMSDDSKAREEAIIAASECPTGRLVAYEKDGTPIEPEFEPSIEILEDLAQRVSGPLYVKGNIPIESADGTTYEVRNRVALCRCGQSSDKPFCDATHISIRFSDKK